MAVAHRTDTTAHFSIAFPVFVVVLQFFQSHSFFFCHTIINGVELPVQAKSIKSVHKSDRFAIRISHAYGMKQKNSYMFQK